MAIHTIAIQGVAGAYHDIAARRYFGAAKGDTVEIVECDTFDQLCEAVTNNTASAGMMAIENTIAGSILPNYALLQTYNLSVIGETYVRIQHNLLALPGQTVCRTGLTIAVDGIEMGQARERDGPGRPLPVWQGCRTLGAGEIFVMNWQSADSFDGRYFGPIPASSVIGRAIPVWTDRE